MPVTSISCSVTSGSLNDRRPRVAQADTAPQRPNHTGSGMRDAGCEALIELRIPHPASCIPFELRPPLHALLDVLFEAELGRLVPFLPAERLRQVLLRHVRIPERVGVLIPRPIAQVLHELGGRVADV